MRKYLVISIISIIVILSLNILFSLLGVRNSYLLGLAGAITPCTIILIPIFLYRFGIWGDVKVLAKEIVLTLCGFLITFSIIGLFFDTIAKTPFFDSVKIVLVIVLSILAILQIMHRLNFDFLSNITNPFLLGLILPLALSFSSCVLPFFSVNLVDAATNGTGAIILNTLAFGIGIITPAILVGLLGGTAYSLIKKSSVITRIVDYLAGFIILTSIFYLITKIESLDLLNLSIALIFCLFMIFVLVYKAYKSKEKVSGFNLFIIMFSVVFYIYIFVRTLYLSNNFVASNTHRFSCAYEQIICKECSEAGLLLALFAIIFTISYLVVTKSIKLPKIRLKLD